jgi:glutamine amidotransferase
MTAVTVIDYGAGNLLNVVRGLEHLGYAPYVTEKADDIEKASKLVLPGVGAFGDCMSALDTLGLVEPIKTYLASGNDFLGICVGMQILFEGSDEFGTHPGLGFLPGRVMRIPQQNADGVKHKIPNIGWSALQTRRENGWNDTILGHLTPDSEANEMYFVHSYMGQAQGDDELAYIDYHGIHITAAVKRGNVYGVQFHPEKSGDVGLSVLKAFVTLNK